MPSNMSLNWSADGALHFELASSAAARYFSRQAACRVMKLIPLVLLAVVTSQPAVAREELPREITQAGMNEAAKKKLHSSEAEMNKLLSELVDRAGPEADAIAALRAAQQAWEAYREAQVAALWPSPDKQLYGSVQPMCAAYAREALTKERVQELRSMLRREEGNVCGSQWPD
jgi:uncharacterized protein YecT (DUF1311 family)